MAEQYDVTSVGASPAEDRAHRMRVYFIAMSIRVACVASLFFVRGWWILVVGAGAVLLPYFAVLFANQAAHGGGRTPEAPAPLELTGADSPPTGGASDPAAPGPAGSETLLVVDVLAERRAADEDPR
ncbi:DUF3099 domain-containing protein [Leucobacter weissii]|uniref:DUF3099 domain-containing protein n=1 Tax=Leucobacter weissii TaxID=1983706 RepID=A0A939MLR4_9MICO|nr:DUF3099 domain-containing protein [Leucobacter weissii]MBO1902585.1 DUF3099 domain-containing protein [Leucobacter weissii]